MYRQARSVQYGRFTNNGQSSLASRVGAPLAHLVRAAAPPVCPICARWTDRALQGLQQCSPFRFKRAAGIPCPPSLPACHVYFRPRRGGARPRAEACLLLSSDLSKPNQSACSRGGHGLHSWPMARSSHHRQSFRCRDVDHHRHLFGACSDRPDTLSTFLTVHAMPASLRSALGRGRPPSVFDLRSPINRVGVRSYPDLTLGASLCQTVPLCSNGPRRYPSNRAGISPFSQRAAAIPLPPSLLSVLGLSSADRRPLASSPLTPVLFHNQY